MNHGFPSSRHIFATGVAFMLAACGNAPERQAEKSDPSNRVEIQFEGRVDPAAGTMTIVRLGATGQSARGLAPLDVAQDGVPGSGPTDSVELVTTDINDSCGGDEFCGDVTLRTFYEQNLENVYAQITSLTPAIGHLPLNSDPSAMGLNNQFGLWSYGSLSSGDSSTRTWVFEDLGGGPFTFRGVVWGDLAPACPPRLATTFEGGNGQDGNFFDLVALDSIVVESFTGSFQEPGMIPIEIYAVTGGGTFVGKEANPMAWTLIDSFLLNVGAPDTPIPYNRKLGFPIAANATQGFYITTTDGTSVNYTDGTALGAVYSQNASLQIREGRGVEYPFGATFTPRVWNGRVHYSVVGQICL